MAVGQSTKIIGIFIPDPPPQIASSFHLYQFQSPPSSNPLSCGMKQVPLGKYTTMQMSVFFLILLHPPRISATASRWLTTPMIATTTTATTYSFNHDALSDRREKSPVLPRKDFAQLEPRSFRCGAAGITCLAVSGTASAEFAAWLAVGCHSEYDSVGPKRFGSPQSVNSGR